MMRALFIVPLFFLFACDPAEMKQAEPGKHGSASKSGAVSGSASAAEPAAFASLSDCLLSCEHQKLSADNQATCRLNCDNSYGAEPAPVVASAPSADPVGDAATCMGRCYASSGGVTDECVKGCKATAASAANPPTTHALDHLTGCVASCENDRALKPTDRATCELNCAQVARVDVPPASSGQASLATPTP